MISMMKSMGQEVQGSGEGFYHDRLISLSSGAMLSLMIRQEDTRTCIHTLQLRHTWCRLFCFVHTQRCILIYHFNSRILDISKKGYTDKG